VDRYYSSIYFGFINVGGYLYWLPGNLSGQTNTATDNSLLTLFGVMLHAIMCGKTYEQFLEDEICIVGDDLLISDVHGIYSPDKLQATYSLFGMKLESPVLTPQQPHELTFMGCSPTLRNGEWLYAYRSDKLSCALNYVARKSSLVDKLNRYKSITQLLFADKPVFEHCRDVTLRFASENKDFIRNACSDVAYELSDSYLLKLYNGLEGKSLCDPEFFFSGGSKL